MESRRRFTTISLPKERAEQLREIAAARKITLSELMGIFVEAEIRTGILPNGIPGYELKKRRNEVELNFAGSCVRVSKARLLEVANCIFRCASDTGFFEFVRVDDRQVFSIRRAGRGIKIELRQNVKVIAERTHTIDVARDIARHMTLFAS